MLREEQATQGDLVSHAYFRIRELIISGRLAPGARIIESELAERLDISRTPVRSALQRLQQEGWVHGAETGKQLRLTVSPLTQEDARELYEIIGTLEGLAARWSAALPEDEREAIAAELRGINDRLTEEAARAQPDPHLIFELYSSFHLRLVDSVPAPRLRVLHRAIKPQADRYRQIYSTALALVAPHAAAEHAAVHRGIAAGDPAGAEEAARLHWRNAAERMSQIIATWGEKGSW
jgi:DNA-binding GntR family transcriptional regulator